MMAVGMLPTIMNKASFPSSVWKSRLITALRIFTMSFLNATKTTHKVPMCSIKSKNMYEGSFMLKPMQFRAILRWPVLETGSHSVMPWMIARIKV